MPEEPLARVCRRHGFPSARSFEQAEAGGALEGRDLLADRGLGVPELDSGANERAGLYDRLERNEVADLDARQ